MTKILIMPPGAENAPVSHGKDRFTQYLEDPKDPNTRWLVEVPDDTVEHFCLTGGFQVYEPQMRRRLSGEVVPLIQDGGSAPFSLSFDGDSYHSELVTLDDDTIAHVVALPTEGVAQALSHPGVTVLSVADHQAPPAHPGKGWELMELNRRLLGQPPLQGGGVRELDVFPSNVKRAQHPDGIENPEREAEILAAEAKTTAEHAKAEGAGEAEAEGDAEGAPESRRRKPKAKG